MLIWWNELYLQFNGFSDILMTASARSKAPAPPFAQWSATTASLAPAFKAAAFIISYSAWVSDLENY